MSLTWYPWQQDMISSVITDMNNKKGGLVWATAKEGAGKTTVLNHLLKQYDGVFVRGSSSCPEMLFTLIFVLSDKNKGYAKELYSCYFGFSNMSKIESLILEVTSQTDKKAFSSLGDMHVEERKKENFLCCIAIDDRDNMKEVQSFRTIAQKLFPAGVFFVTCPYK